LYAAMVKQLILSIIIVLGACSGPDLEVRAPPALAPAFVLLDSAFTSAEKDTLRQLLPDSAIVLHFSVGMWLRNEAGLWQGGPIADSLRARGVIHPDDMSDLILRAYGYYLRGDSVDLDALIRQIPPPPEREFVDLPQLDTSEAP
jgi:hypothetical protein